MPKLNIGVIHRSIRDIALGIKSGDSSLSQNYTGLKILIKSTVSFLLERGYTYNDSLLYR